MLKSVVFDVDDTIYDQQQPFNLALKEVFPFISETDYSPLYIRFRVHSDENFCKVVAKEWTLEQMRSYRIAQSLTELNYPLITAETALLFQAVYEEKLAHITMPACIEQSLDLLKDHGIQISVITNGPAKHQHKKIDQLHLANWVTDNQVIVSTETDFEKPDVGIFKLAEKQFKLDPASTLYVGDNFDNDVVGCKKAGWHALWFNHRNRSLKADQTAIHDFEVNQFEEIFSAFEELLQISHSAV